MNFEEIRRFVSAETDALAEGGGDGFMMENSAMYGLTDVRLGLPDPRRPKTQTPSRVPRKLGRPDGHENGLSKR